MYAVLLFLLCLSLASPKESPKTFPGESSKTSPEESPKTSPGESPQAPNLVMIVADDLGWGDAPWHDPHIQAPRH